MRTKTKPVANRRFKEDEAKLTAFLKQFPDGVWSIGPVPKNHKKGPYEPSVDEIIAGAQLPPRVKAGKDKGGKR
jgi:hypothetical protein